MARKRKANPEVTAPQEEAVQQELPVETPAQPVEDVVATEVTETPQEVEAPSEKAVPAQAAPESVEEKTDSSEDSVASIVEITNKLNELYANSSLVAQATGFNSQSYCLIKVKNTAYCFARVLERNGKPQADFLSNVPPAIHAEIVESLKKLRVTISKTSFFHPSGIL